MRNHVLTINDYCTFKRITKKILSKATEEQSKKESLMDLEDKKDCSSLSPDFMF